MEKIKIFESKALIGVDETNPAFRREQVAEGESVYCLSVTYPGITIHQTRNSVHTNQSSHLIKLHLRTFVKEENRFLDGTWHMTVDTNLTGIEEYTYVKEVLEILMNNPEYDIEVYEYGLFGMHDVDKHKEDKIFNWYNRHLGEIWIAKEDLEKNEELKMLVEEHNSKQH